MPVHFIYLAAAIVAETAGTMALQASHQFTRLVPSLIAVVSYAIAFYLLAQTLRVLPVGIMYAIWSGAGIVLIALMAFALYGQRLDLPAVIGIALIIAGILVIHLFSSTSPH